MHLQLLRRLNISKEEAGPLALLFLSAILLGGFLSTFDIQCHALFLANWDASDLTLAYIFSGALGMLIFGIYTFLHKRLHYKIFHGVNLLIVLLLSVAFNVLQSLHLIDSLSFISLVIMLPVNLLAFLSFWRFHRIIIYPKRTKFIFPILDTGVLIGLMAGGIGAAIMLNYYAINILYTASTLFITGLLAIQYPIHWIHRYNASFNHKTDRRIPVRASLFLLWSTRGTRNLLLFSLVSSILAYYLHYGFINITEIRFNTDNEFPVFYSIFLVVMSVIVWFIDHFLVHKIMYSYDSPFSLALIPLGLIIMFAATIGGSYLLQRMGIADALPFILLIGINKIIYEVAKNSLQIPGFRTIYRTMDIRFLQLAIPRVEGLIVMVGLTITGLILFFAHRYISGITLFVTSGIGICVVWFVYAVKLIKSYKALLKESYRKLRINRYSGEGQQSYREKLRRILVNDDPAKVIPAMRLSAQIEPLTYVQSLQRMLANPQPEIHDYVLQCIREESLLDMLNDLKVELKKENANKTAIKNTIQEFEKRKKLLEKDANIEDLVRSRKLEDRILAAEIIGSQGDTRYTSTLINLSREIEPNVKLAAVKSMARISSANHSYLLIEFLSSPEFYAYAFEALIEIGDPALDYLERLFINPNTPDHVLSRVIRIYGRVATPKAIDFLLDKLDNQNRRITLASIAALHEANFQANNLNLNRILNIVVRTIHTIGWNFMISISLPAQPAYTNLRHAYLQEIETNYDLLFDLLSLAYNTRTIREIRELLLGSAADISHAIEMLDHFIYEDIKPVLFPIIENISIEERVKRLQYYFPIETMPLNEMLSSTLTRDYNLLSLYPRICAMQLALETDAIEINQELISNLFHPNELLREVAALVIHKRDPELFDAIAERLDEDVQFEIRQSLERVNQEKSYLLVEKFTFIKSNPNFSGIPEAILIEISRAFRELRFASQKHVNLDQSQEGYTLFMLIDGVANLRADENNNQEIIAGQVYYSETLVKSGFNTMNVEAGSLLLVINKERTDALLFDYAEIASCVLSCVEHFKIAS